MTLYVVHVGTDIVVEATSDDEAREVAKLYHKEIEPAEFTAVVGRTVRCSADLPVDWNMYCLPWNKSNREATIGQILGKYGE